MAKANKKLPYSERTDLEKLESQWRKRGNLHRDSELSAAVVRAATAAEIAANLAIRREFASHTDLKPEAVDSFLRWANGLNGKMTNLLLPLRYASKHRDTTYLESFSAVLLR